jgi:hypothetical protein
MAEHECKAHQCRRQAIEMRAEIDIWKDRAISLIRDQQGQHTHHDAIRAAAIAVVERWDTPLWKDAPATADYIAALRDALAR